MVARKSCLVPFRWPLEVYLDDLFGICDVKPAPVALPALRKYLDEHAAQRRVRNMRNAVTIGFHIEFQLLVFLDGVLFDIFEIDAGVLYRRLLLSARNFNRDTGLRIRFLLWGLRCLRGRWRVLRIRRRFAKVS